MKFSAYFIAALVLLPSISYAQFSNFGISYNNQSVDVAIPRIDDRIKELNTQPIPQNDLALIRELDKIDNEIGTASYASIPNKPLSEAKKKYDVISQQLNSIIASTSNIDCNAGIDDFRKTRQRFYAMLGQLEEMRQFIPIDTSGARPAGYDEDDKKNCQDYKTEVSSNNFDTSFKAMLDSASSTFTQTISDADKMAAANARLLDALTKARTKLRDALNSGSSQQKITANLPWLITAIGGSCFVAMLIVRSSDKQIQMEWITSGQLIQFVTIMILLSILAALGLSDIIKENTLGTLLGSIAGYILAQGVGRAAANNVTRANRVPPTDQ